MSSALVGSVGLLLLFTAYHLYGKFLARSVFVVDPEAICPAVSENDGIDYVPSNKHVLFGHHFTSIAGISPIVGPAIAVIWGWLPALLWIILGSIFMGAVHDFGCLIISTKNKGRSIPDLTSRIITPRARILFLLIVMMTCWIVIAVFGFVIATLFVNYPETVFPINVQIIVAIIVGYLFFKMKVDILIPSIVALLILWSSIFVGIKYPLELPSLLGHGQIIEKEYVTKGGEKAKRIELIFPLTVSDLSNSGLFNSEKLTEFVKKSRLKADELINSTGKKTRERLAQLKNVSKFPLKMVRNKVTESWILLLLIYIFIASSLPVWILLQPRDYINSHQLFFTMGAMYLGLFLVNPGIKAPMVNLSPQAPFPWFPFLFITIACGAISGFHSLVSSGTTSKQISSEKDSCYIGYGAMLTEGAVALMAILACCAGFTSQAAWNQHYASWEAAKSLGAKMSAFVNGGAFFLQGGIGIPIEYGAAIIVIMLISFAATTIDSCCRIQRLFIQEVGQFTKIPLLSNLWIASIIAAFSPMILVFGGENLSWVKLWPIFGATNQLLAGLSLLVLTVYLIRKKRPWLFTFIPMVFVLSVTILAMLFLLRSFIFIKFNPLLILISTALLLIAAWIIFEAIRIFNAVRTEGKELADNIN
ncbi:carbon starvation protein A [Candidatus Riflebacteria bacterium]